MVLFRDLESFFKELADSDPKTWRSPLRMETQGLTTDGGAMIRLLVVVSMWLGSTVIKCRVECGEIFSHQLKDATTPARKNAQTFEENVVVLCQKQGIKVRRGEYFQLEPVIF